MERFKRILDKLKTPNVVFAILFSICAIAIMTITIVLVCLGYNNVFCYLLYALSAISLGYMIYIIVYFMPKMRQSMTKLLQSNKFTNELLQSYGYRSSIFVLFSFAINIMYALAQAVFAILTKSVWFGALATYYIALSLIRGGIIYVSRKRKKRGENFTLQQQVKAYRNCGIYLMILNFALVGAIVQMVVSNQGFKYAGIMIYVVATYTFYKLGMSIYNIIKASKNKDYTIQSIKNISFADALVSLLALQTALLEAFSQNYQPYLPNSLTGAAVSITIIGLGIWMIVKGNQKLKQLQQKEEKNE